ALRTGVAAPDTPCPDGDKEQPEGADDQQGREQYEVLRPECGPEDMEFARRQVPPDGLTAIPGQPHGAEVQQEEQAATDQPKAAEQAGEGAGVDFFTLGVEV